MKKLGLLLTLTLLRVFLFAQSLPTVTTNAVTSISQIRATGGGNVTSNGGATITNRGIVWSTTQNPTITLTTKTSRGKGPNVDGLGDVVDYLTPLQPTTTYYVRAYATNSVGTAYGNQVTFTTSSFVSGRKYYISSSTGNNNNNGTSPSTPWQTMHVLFTKNTGNNATFQPGDTVCFKRGEVFSEGSYDSYSMVYWDNRPNTGSDSANFPQYFTASSGTKDHPIVITNYGDTTLPLPNVYFRDATYPAGHNTPHNVWHFAGVSWVVIDGIQFNDTRFPYTDKSNPAYTTAPIIWGEINNSKVYYNGSNVTSTGCPVQGAGCDTVLGSNSNVNNRKSMISNCTIKNCYFSNNTYGIGGVYCDGCVITKNSFINLKSSVDTIGTYDIMSGPIDGLSGMNMEISHNYFKSYWGKSGRVSSCQGMGGVALDMFSLKNSKIVYNTFIDGRHVFEIGNLDRYDSLAGSIYDTFAFNKVIGNHQYGYIHGSAGDPFQGNNHNLYIWNNVMIENNNSRMSGPRYGDDIYGDGINFSQFWFFKNKNLSTNYNTQKATFSSSSFNVTLLATNGVYQNSRVYGPEQSTIFPYCCTPVQPTTVPVVTNAPPFAGNVVTLDIKPNSSGSNVDFTFYPPLSALGTTWSQPNNPSASGVGNAWDNTNLNSRMAMQYSSDQMQWGMGYDTLIDMRNNIFYNTTGLQMLYGPAKPRYKHSNNIYYMRGGYSYTAPNGFSKTNLTRLGGDGGVQDATLGTKDRIMTTAIFKDTTSALPENWDLHLISDTSYAVSNGSAIAGFTKDFGGNTLTVPMNIGLYKYTSATPKLTLVSSTNVTCITATNGSFTVTANGGTAPYTYKVNNSAYTTTTTYSNLAPGTYMVTVKDAKGLTSTLNVTIKSSSVACP